MADLQPKHYKAIELFEEGMLSIKEIAKACTIPQESMYDLFEGNSHKVGETAHLFKAEVDKVTARSSAKIKTLTKDNKKLALIMMNDRLKELRKNTVPTELQSAEIVKILNSLGKMTPSVEVGSFTITKGLSEREIVDEFKRLSALARFALNGGTVSRLKQGGAGQLPEPSSGRDSVQEE